MTTIAQTLTPRAPVANAPRVDLYATIHKALRLFMSDTLGRVGWVDVSDADELGATLAQVEALLDACRNHLSHENHFVHPAIEARQPGGSVRIEGEHHEHLEAIAALGADLAALRALPSTGAAHRLYQRLALFVADNFAHMHVEETAHNAALWSAYSDAELAQIHERLVASSEPAEMAAVLRWMVPAMSPAERAAMLGAMQQQMPPDALRGVLAIVRPHLGDTGWAKLARDLGIAQVPFSFPTA
jgi:hypothetical protein